MFPFDSRITLVGNPRFIIPKGEHKQAGDRLMRRLHSVGCYCEDCGVDNLRDRGDEVSFRVLILQDKRNLTNALSVECEYSRLSRELWTHSGLGEKICNAVVAWVVFDYLQVKPENAADCVDALEDGLLPPEDMRPERTQKDSLPEEVAARVLKELQQNAIPVAVDGYTPRGCQAAVQIVNTKRPERDYFSDPNLSVLFGTHVNTIANWRKGSVKPPEGFSEAFEKKDCKAMCACAEKYKANRECADAMNTKGVEHGISEEQMHRQRLK